MTNIDVLPVSIILGRRVRNRAGEELGRFEEVMLDTTRGRVAYAVLSFGGFLGVKNKLFAIPWEAITLDQNSGEFVLNIEKSQLENAPGFNKDEWPETTRQAWLVDVYNHFGYHPYWK